VSDTLIVYKKESASIYFGADFFCFTLMNKNKPITLIPH